MGGGEGDGGGGGRRVGGGRRGGGRGEGEGEGPGKRREGVGLGALGEGRGWGKGKGLSFFCFGGRGGGRVQGGGGEKHLFLKLREVWEESFSVPSPFFLLRRVFAGGRGVGGGLGEVINGTLGFEGEGGEEGKGWVGRWKGFWEGRV